MTNSLHTLWGKTFAAKTWHAETLPPMLALHGWLDNAGSFDNLAPQLNNYHVIAPDLAGHGLSDYRSEDAAYNLWQDVGDMDQLIRQLNLAPLIIMGHSRGAMISTMLAALYPERVKALVLLDGLMPGPVAVDDTVKQMRTAFEDRRTYLAKPLRHYDSYEDAIKSRLKGPIGLSRRAVDSIAARGLGHCEKGYFWRADPRLRGASEVKFTAEHNRVFIENVRCPTLLLLSRSAYDFYQSALATNNNMQALVVEGSHHFHLEDTHGEVGEIINNFLVAI